MRMRPPIARAALAAGALLAAFLLARGPRIAVLGAMLPARTPIGGWFRSAGERLREPQRMTMLADQVASLQSERATLERRIAELEAASASARHAPPANRAVVPARVIAVVRLPGTRTITVAYPKDVTIRRGDPVVVRGSLVGSVIGNDGNTAIVRLLTDGESRTLAALTVRGAPIGVVTATTGGGLTLTHIPRDVDLTPGTTIMTAATEDGRIPPGIPIGQTLDVRDDTGGFFRTAVIDPFSDARDALTVDIWTVRP